MTTPNDPHLYFAANPQRDARRVTGNFRAIVACCVRAYHTGSAELLISGRGSTPQLRCAEVYTRRTLAMLQNLLPELDICTMDVVKGRPYVHGPFRVIGRIIFRCTAAHPPMPVGTG